MQWSFLIFSVFTYAKKYVNIFKQRAVGSAGRAPALQAGGQEFESPTVHKSLFAEGYVEYNWQHCNNRFADKIDIDGFLFFHNQHHVSY